VFSLLASWRSENRSIRLGKKLVTSETRAKISAMTVSRLRLAKTETRDFAERDRVGQFTSRLGETCEWNMTNRGFFTAFVVIAAVLATLALIAR